MHSAWIGGLMGNTQQVNLASNIKLHNDKTRISRPLPAGSLYSLLIRCILFISFSSLVVSFPPPPKDHEEEYHHHHHHHHIRAGSPSIMLSSISQCDVERDAQ